ncbi:MAG: ATP-dependent DNA helicase [Pseudomonadales bacterium]|nr:ATP-dependent DNA helicase [Pseudomonadales bacterium]
MSTKSKLPATVKQIVRPAFRISVTELVEQVEKSGDINFRFSGRSTAMEGIRGHQRLQQSRGDDYQAEKQLSHLVQWSDIELQVTGRVDGYYPQLDNFIVEEIKTTRVAEDLIPATIKCLHWGQVKVYAYLLSLSCEFECVTLRLCYLDLDTGTETQLNQQCSKVALATYFNTLITKYATYLRQLLRWRECRDQSIQQLEFPYATYRAGQRQMAVSVYRALKEENQLVVQAPTGIGKTLASIFPAVKALRELAYEKVFFLSAKTSGQKMAEATLSTLKQSGLFLRDVTLTSKAVICFNPGSPCDAEHCQFARDYYTRLPKVIDQQLMAKQSLRRADIEVIAREHDLCPYELSLDLAAIADVIICDYNYVFDPAVYLRRFFGSEHSRQSRFALLLDESHNLVERGREMFSATICKDDILAVRRLIKNELPQLGKCLARINSEFLALQRSVKELQRSVKEVQQDGGCIQLDQCPDKLIRTISHFIHAAEVWLQLNQPVDFQQQFLQLYFAAIKIIRTIDAATSSDVFLLLFEQGKCYFKVFCLDPGLRLKQGFERVNSSICFSATLTPVPYFAALMGIKGSANWYNIESPFAAQNLAVFTTGYLATTYRNRAHSLYELVDTLATVVASNAGNYLVFFPSYAYLLEVSSKFAERYSALKIIVQRPGMDAAEQQEFLQAFDQTEGTLLAFAVMGGVFGEGIDLQGRRLIGAIIVGVGLPQLCVERDLIRAYFDSDAAEIKHPVGFEFAYQYPGMNKVLQTAGRVIRSETDRGIICLIDHRFNEARYQRLFPPGWQPRQARNRQQLGQYLRDFWQNKQDVPIPGYKP